MVVVVMVYVSVHNVQTFITHPISWNDSQLDPRHSVGHCLMFGDLFQNGSLIVRSICVCVCVCVCPLLLLPS